MRFNIQGRTALVYTAIFGDYDDLKEPSAQTVPTDFICFTDARLPRRVGSWRIVRVARDTRMHARMQAKVYKILSQDHLVSNGRLSFKTNPFWFRRRYDLSIWIDGSLQIKSPSFVADMRQYVCDAPWAMFAHPDRDCIYDESVVSASMRKYRNLPVMEQVESYRSTVPPHSGLYACGVIVRKEPIPAKLSDVNRLWYKENVKWTYQDQLSLPYVLRKTDSLLHPARIEESLWHNKWFNYVRHRHSG